MGIKDHLEILLPPDTPPIVRWRLIMAGIASLGLFHILWACGWLNYLGFGTGFAKADDLEKRIHSALDPVQKEVKEQSRTLAQISEQLKQQLANSKASEIRALAAKRCLAKTYAEKEAYNAELEIKLREYRDIQGYPYMIPTCEELK